MIKTVADIIGSLRFGHHSAGSRFLTPQLDPVYEPSEEAKMLQPGRSMRK